MAELELKFLGDLEVSRDGRLRPLPPSRKTRALLAYLALHQRAFRREHLCELLWEVPDDPRGSLRWSLTKIRHLVDTPQRRRIIADRLQVSFARDDVAIDVADLHALQGPALARTDTLALEQAVHRHRGSFLEGLDFPDFHDFHAWCMGEREAAARAQATLLGALIERLDGEPERALPHARALVGLRPYDEAARAGLIRLLLRLGQDREAARQHQLATRMLREMGIASSGALLRARRSTSVAATAPPPAPTPGSAPAPSPAPRLVGREPELRRLVDALRHVARQRDAGGVLICGEPGIGKSHLLEALASHARDADALVLNASAFESEAIRPFSLWIDALQRAAPDAAAGIFSGSRRDHRDHLFAALSDFIAAALTSHPVVLIFDDLQWCDESSAAALHYVARINRRGPLLVLLAVRDGELREDCPAQQAIRGLRRDGLLQELRLGPLSPEEVRELIGERAPDADAGRLSRECSGNPLLAIELARAETAGDAGGSLDEVIRERLARLGANGADVLRWAALLAPRIDLASLIRATGMDGADVAQAMADAEHQAILNATETGFRFSHELVTRAIYDDIPPARRQLMHRRIAEQLERDAALDLNRAADLAHHASLSGDPALAARAMVCAGRLCLRFFANDEALALAQRGLQQVEALSGSERICLTLELHDVALTAAPLEDWQASAERYVALAEQALEHRALSHARLGYYMASYVRWLHGQWGGAREETLQAERVTRGGSAEEQVIGMTEAAKCLAMLERDLPRAEAMLMQAQALARHHQLNLRHPALPTALGMLRYHENCLDEAEEYFMEARTLCKCAGDRVNEFQANEYLVMIDFERGRIDSACARCAALVEIGDRLREGSEAPFAQALQALCRYARGDDSGPMEAALQALRLADAKYRLAYILTRTALLDIDRGRPTEALARATEALECASVLDRATEMLLAHLALARAHRTLGEAAEYRRHAAAIADLADAPVAVWARQRAQTLATAAAG